MDNFNAAFQSNLTEVGQNQLKVVENHIKKAHKLYSSSGFYAPLSPLIQSSGFGKSKICDELLLTHPGITAVFRGPNPENNIYSHPPEQTWIKTMMNFIYMNTIDELPEKNADLFTADASKYSIGRMLLAIRTLIVAYYKWFGYLRENKNLSQEAAIKTIGEHFRSGSTEWGHEPSELVFKIQEIKFVDLFNHLEVLLKSRTGAESTISELGIPNSLVKELMPESKIEFPFLFIFDEASTFDKYLNLPSRISGLHVLRRALHLLKIKTPIYFLIIGTNSDAIDFSPALSIDSIRYLKRANLLPAIWLSRNSGILSEKLRLHEIEVLPSFLLNRNVMKLFFTMGRPLWASVDIEEALNLAVTKISNGNNGSMEALISCLLCRADLNVVPSSILCRNLVKSHMAVVYSISTDSRSMKIGYPSEPALALASRRIFDDIKIRETAFSALFEFLQRRAIDKGRISETIAEHFILFAVDDVVNNENYLNDFVAKQYLLSEVGGYENKNIDKVLSCNTFLLDIEWANNAENEVNSPEIATEPLNESGKNESCAPETVPESPKVSEKLGEVAHDEYHVINVTYLLQSLLTESVYLEMAKYLPDFEPLMKGFVNVSHFVNLESDSTEILSELSQTSPRPFKIDRSLLKMGLIRGCGFALPPGTFGLDFIIPVLLNFQDSTRRPNYSYIGIQVKTIAESFYTEVAKTALPFVIEKCLKHMECVDRNHHSGCMSDEEYEEIIANQLTLIMCMDRDNVANRVRGSFFSAKPQLSSSLKRTRMDKKDEKEQEGSSSSDYEDALEGDEDSGSESSKEIVETFSKLTTTQSQSESLKSDEKRVKKLKELEKEYKIEYSKIIAFKIWPRSSLEPSASTNQTAFEAEKPTYFNYPTFGEMGNDYKPDLFIKNVIDDNI